MFFLKNITFLEFMDIGPGTVDSDCPCLREFCSNLFQYHLEKARGIRGVCEYPWGRPRAPCTRLIFTLVPAESLPLTVLLSFDKEGQSCKHPI